MRKSAQVLQDAGSAYAVSQQYPKEVQERRRALVPIMKQARLNGSEAYLVVDKLYIDKQTLVQESGGGAARWATMRNSLGASFEWYTGASTYRYVYTNSGVSSGFISLVGVGISHERTGAGLRASTYVFTNSRVSSGLFSLVDVGISDGTSSGGALRISLGFRNGASSGFRPGYRRNVNRNKSRGNGS